MNIDYTAKPSYTVPVRCPDCGKALRDCLCATIIKRWAEDVDLVEPRSQPAQAYGWRCPVCGAVMAPWVRSCVNPHVTVVTATATEIRTKR